MASIEGEYGRPLDLPSIRWPTAGARGGLGNRRTATHTHQGVDLSAPVGTKWLAIADGEIVRVVSGPPPAGVRTGFGGYGRVAVLRHVDSASGRPLYVLYAHGDSVLVRQGQMVRKGDVIGTVGRSQYSTRPTRPEGSMGSHLHIEGSFSPYPQGSEARTRVDLGQFLRGVPGITFARPPASPPVARNDARPTDEAPTAAPPTAAENGGGASRELAERPPPNSDDPAAKENMRSALMARLIRTDLAVFDVERQLRAANLVPAAQLIRGAWERSRGLLWPLLNAPSRLGEIRAAVNGWLARIDEIATQARALLPDSFDAQIAAIRARLRDIWERGINWAREQLEELGREILINTGAGVGTVLILLALAWAWGRR